MLSLRWLVGDQMSDEVPDSAGGAVRVFLGSLGFIVALIGAEMVAEKGGDRIVIGFALIAASLPIFLSAVMWKWFRQKVGKLFADRLVAIANDPRWWIISFFLALFSMRLVMFGIDFPWITAGIIVVLMCLIVWGYFATRNKSASEVSAVKPVPAPATNKAQDDQDLLLLLDYALYQSAVLMMDGLLDGGPKTTAAMGPLELGAVYAANFTSEREFVEHVGNRLDAGNRRRDRFFEFMRTSRQQAEWRVKEIPPDQRPADIDPLLLREQLIVHHQCVGAINFLEHEKKEAQDYLRGRRDALLERNRARNPS